MNSTEKKSHSYTPFEVMWGRESRYQDLIPHIDNIEVSHEEDLQLEEAILEEFLPMEEEMIDVFSSPLDDPLQSIHLMEESRQKVCELAGDSIRSEQLKQKRQYDKKVNETRYLLLCISLLIYIYLYILFGYF